MASDPSQTVHSIVITRLKDEQSRAKVAAALVRVSKGVTNDQIMKRLASLPWTITRRASEKKAARLIQLLETLGATTTVSPPLRTAPLEDIHQTQLLPETDLLSDSQIKSGLQTVQVPDSPPAAEMEEERPPSEGFSIEPMTLGGILDRSFHICRRHFWRLLGILVIPWIATVGVVVLLGAVVAMAGLAVGMADLKQYLSSAVIVAGVLVFTVVFIFVMVLFFLSQGAIIHAVSNVYLGREVFIGRAYRFVFGRLWKFVLTSILMTLVATVSVVMPMAIGLVLYLICEKVFESGLWSIISWPVLAIVPAYVIPKILLFDKAVIIEDIGYMSAIFRSWNLIKGKADSPWPRGYFVRLIILLNLFILIQLAVTMLVAPISFAAAYLSPEGYGWIGEIISQIASNFAGLVSGLFMAVCMVVYYYDIRNRKEGFDIQMLAEARK